jgi:nitrite reductase/ring-hydroxylating ferredoxin subunit/uncharacterized membrane protein
VVVAEQGAIGAAAGSAVRSVERVEALDGISDQLSNAVHAATQPDAVKNALSGAWLGHAVHPMLTDLPIGFWTSAVVLDIFGGKKSADAAEALLTAGNLSALAAAATGVADWSDSVGRARRAGLVHAVLNAGALTTFSLSLMLRRRGARKTGILVGLVGSGVATASAYLGGHLVYRRGLGVDHSGFEADEQTEEWSDACAESELQDGSPKVVMVNDVPIVLVRENGEIHALLNHCNHAGGPLNEGEFEGGAVTCPWHGSRFSLRDGCVQRGPAALPQPTYETRVTGGNVQVRST